MQTNRFILFTVLSTSTLFTSQQETSGIPLKIRAYVPPGNGLISDVVFPVEVGPCSSIADINQKLVVLINYCAAQEPGCASCGRCTRIRIAQTLKQRNKRFSYFFERMEPLKMTATVAELRAKGFSEDHSLGAIQSPNIKSPTKDEAKVPAIVEIAELKRVEKMRSKSAATRHNA